MCQSSLIWLTTGAEKAAFFSSPPTITPRDDTSEITPPPATPEPANDSAATGPIGLDTSGRVVFLYLATVPWTDEFRRFLQRHAGLFRRVLPWTLRVVFPRPVDQAYGGYQTVIREELETPLQPATIRELKEHFERRRSMPHGRTDVFTEAWLENRVHAFDGPRFTVLYRRWLKHGDGILDSLSSPVTAEALASGTGRSECIVLPHAYRHLAPLVDRRRSTRERVEKRLRRGNREGNNDPHVLNRGAQPGFSEPESSVSERLARDWHRLNDWYNQQKTLGLRP